MKSSAHSFFRVYPGTGRWVASLPSISINGHLFNHIPLSPPFLALTLFPWHSHFYHAFLCCSYNCHIHRGGLAISCCSECRVIRVHVVSSLHSYWSPEYWFLTSRWDYNDLISCKNVDLYACEPLQRVSPIIIYPRPPRPKSKLGPLSHSQVLDSLRHPRDLLSRGLLERAKLRPMSRPLPCPFPRLSGDGQRDFYDELEV